MGNIIIGVMRKALKDVEIKGHLIPKGWCVFANFRSVHLDDKNYECPYKFNPWRWQVREINPLLLSICSFLYAFFFFICYLSNLSDGFVNFRRKT